MPAAHHQQRQLHIRILLPTASRCFSSGNSQLHRRCPRFDLVKNLRMVRMWIVDIHPAPPVVWHLHIFRGYCVPEEIGFDVYTLIVSKLVFNFIESIAAFTQPCECHQVSEKRAGVAETSTIEAVAGRFSAPNPQRGRLWGRSVGKEGRGGGSAFGSWSLLAPTRGRLQVREAKGGGSEYSDSCLLVVNT